MNAHHQGKVNMATLSKESKIKEIDLPSRRAVLSSQSDVKASLKISNSQLFSCRRKTLRSYKEQKEQKEKQIE
jgi:hypothetical protein